MDMRKIEIGQYSGGRMAEERDLGWLGLLVVVAWVAGCVGAVVALGWIVTAGLWFGMIAVCGILDALWEKRSRWALAKLVGSSLLLALAVIVIKGGL